MNFSTTTLAFLYAYQFPVLFFGAVFLGETVIIPAAFLTGEGIFSLGFVFWSAFFGTIVADTLCFAAGPALFRFVHSFSFVQKRSERVLAHLADVYANRPFNTLLISKFVFGTRFLTVIYLSQKLSPVRFFFANLGSAALWLGTVVAVGYLAGRSIVNLLPFLSDATYILIVIVILVLGTRFGPAWFAKRLPPKTAGQEPPGSG